MHPGGSVPAGAQTQDALLPGAGRHMPTPQWPNARAELQALHSSACVAAPWLEDEEPYSTAPRAPSGPAAAVESQAGEVLGSCCRDARRLESEEVELRGRLPPQLRCARTRSANTSTALAVLPV